MMEKCLEKLIAIGLNWKSMKNKTSSISYTNSKHAIQDYHQNEMWKLKTYSWQAVINTSLTRKNRDEGPMSLQAQTELPGKIEPYFQIKFFYRTPTSFHRIGSSDTVQEQDMNNLSNTMSTVKYAKKELLQVSSVIW